MATLTPRQTEELIVVDPTPPLIPRLPSWRTLLGLVFTTIAITSLCGLGAYVASSELEQERWEAASQIEYRGEAWVETAAAEAGSRSRVEPIADLYGIEFKEFDERLTAGAVPGTQLLEYRFEDPVPARALDIVTSLTDAYLKTSPSSKSDAVTRLEEEVVDLQGQLVARKAELNAVAGPVGVEPSAVERIAETEVVRVQELLTEAQDKLLVAELAVIAEEDLQPVVVAAPYLSDEPVAPKPERRAAFGVLAGLLISALIAASVLTHDKSA